MHPKSSNTIPRAGLLRLVAVGLITTATTLSAQAQTSTSAPAEQTSAQPAAPTSAQVKGPEDVVVLNPFTVEGSFAGSLAMAADEKQNAPNIVEVIAAEDIGKLPDVSIADALTRLTGVTSQRVNGRDQEITIRGFSPDFSVGTFDGVEQATTDDNRAVQYDQYPSELVGGVTVYKTGEADIVGGLAGTVDLETTSPLAAGHRIVALSAFYNWTQYPQLTAGVKKAGESYSASYIDQFANGTEGIYVGYAHTENPYEGEQFQAWGYPNASDGNLVLGGAKFYDQSELLKRDSVVAVLESKPNDFIHSKIDVFYSHFNDDELLNGLQVPMYWSSAQLQPGYTVTNGLITNYTFKNIQPVVDNQVVDNVTNLQSYVLNLDLGEKTEWPVKILAGYSEAKRNEEVLETYAGLGFNQNAPVPDTFVVTQMAGPNPPQVVSSTDYSNASLFTITDPQGWGTGTYPTTGQEGYLKYFAEKDVVRSAKIQTSHDLGLPVLKDVVAGVGVTSRSKYDAQAPTGYLVNADGQAQDPLPKLVGTTNLNWIGNLDPIDWSAQGLVSSGALKFIQNPNPGTFVGDDYNVTESIVRPFVKFDLKGDLGGIPFTGNIGVVADLTSQSSTGISSGGSGDYVFPVSASASYADILPTLTLVFKPTSQDYIRLFVGREEQRPRMYDMRASRDFSYNATYATSTTISPWGGSAGNPDLHPWLADSVDLSIEHYFAHNNGYVSVAVFEKKLLSYIYQENTLTNFAGYPYTSATAPVINEGYSSQPQNGQGGNVSGVEGTIQIDSEVLTGGGLKGFGLVANGLIVDSNIQPWGPNNPSAPLPDLSKKSANFTLYYEGQGILKGLSVRGSLHYQSETREYIVQFGAPSPASFGTPGDGFSEEIPFHTIDGQISYDFRSGPLKGLGIYLEARNLTNAALITYNNGDPRQLENWQKYGASYRTGVTYKF